MSTLIIPIAPLHRSKSRLEKSLTRSQIKEFTIAMVKDLGTILMDVHCFNQKILYCASEEILEMASDLGLIGIQEQIHNSSQSFDEMITNLDNAIINKYDPESTVIAFLDLVLIEAQNFLEIHNLMKNNSLVVCPAIQSAGISILGRKPPNLLNSCFSNPSTPSIFALFKNAKEKKIEKIAIYDSFRASFDVDITRDLILAYEYLKMFNLKEKETYKFLKKNLRLTLRKNGNNDNREFTICEK